MLVNLLNVDPLFVRTALISRPARLHAYKPLRRPIRRAAQLPAPFSSPNDTTLRNLLRPATGQAQPALGAYEHR